MVNRNQCEYGQCSRNATVTINVNHNQIKWLCEQHAYLIGKDVTTFIQETLHGN